MSKKQKITIGLYITIILLTIVGISYSYFMSTSNNTNNQEVVIKSGTLSLVFRDVESSQVGGKLKLGSSIEKKFTIQNTGDVDAYAKLNWLNFENNYLDGSLIYSLSYSTSENGTYTNIVTNKNVPRSDTPTTLVLRDGLLVPAGQKYYYKLTISFIDSGIDQTADLSAHLTSTFTLSSGNELPSEITLKALKLTLASGTPNFNNTSCSSGCGENTVGLYKFDDGDDYGDTYYFRGDVTNNYVKFGKWASHSKNNGTTTKYYYSLEECNADTEQTGTCTSINSSKAGQDMYWRIIRINGDGSLRMIYDGAGQAYANGTSDTNRLALTNTPWNSSYNDAKYVGYMFGSSTSTYRQTDITANDYANFNNAVYNEVNSNIKTQLENWYEQNLNSGYSKYISDEIFCNDRSTPDTTYNKGYGTNQTYYGGNKRLTVGYGTNNATPKLKCEEENDAFTVGTSSAIANDDEGYGNGMLKYPVGLVTADEIVLAGGKYYPTQNTKYYLYKGSWYWAFSPFNYNAYARVFNVHNDGEVGYTFAFSSGGGAPVINLSAEYSLGLRGTGEPESPFSLE